MRNAIVIESDFDFRTIQRSFSGRITKKRYKIIDRYCRKKSFNTHCGCEHDCCGCVHAVNTTFEYSKNLVIVTQTTSLNY